MTPKGTSGSTKEKEEQQNNTSAAQNLTVSRPQSSPTYTGNSIVDYLRQTNRDSSFASRKQLAANYGINDYTGTAAQNTQLLNSLRSEYSPGNTNPVGAGAQTGSQTGGDANHSPTAGQDTNPASETAKSWQQGFQPTELTNHYKTAMLNTDNDRPDEYEAPNRPGPYQSQYETQINSILDTIYNRKPFDVKNDANYNALYDQYRERYQAQAQRAMNDAMASAQAQTGGYGSTYSQAAGQQAYDNTMQGMNDNSLSLLNLAYDIYQGDRANDYNKLNAYQSVDNTDYSRYRDTMADWESDRNFGYQQYRDNVADWQTDRNYNANQYWNSFQQDRSGYENDRTFNYGVDQDEINRDDSLYQNAIQDATSLATKGLPVPSYLTDIINNYNKKYGLSGDAASSMTALAAQAVANAAGSGGGGGGGRSGGGRRGSGKKGSGSTSKTDIYENDTQFKKKYPNGTDGRSMMAQSEYENRYETVENNTYQQSYNKYISQGMIDAKAKYYARNDAKAAAKAWAKQASQQFQIIGGA